MKTLKFRPNLIPAILSGKKTTTWRLFDDKDISPGDILSLLDSETKQEFARAQVAAAGEKPFALLTDEDWSGHERYSSDEEMYARFSDMYARTVTTDTKVKLVRFRLL